MSGFEKFVEGLPNKDNFYSSLTGKKIDDEQYEYILKVWNKFKMKTLKDYHDLHSKCNVLLFVDVFEKFRNNCLIKLYIMSQSLFESSWCKLECNS